MDSHGFELRVGAPKRRVLGRVSLESGEGARPVVILVHGYLASMDWGFVPLLERALVTRGLAVVAFNLSGSGVSGRNPGELDDEPAFSTNTYARELEDVAAVTAFVRSGCAGANLGSAALDTNKLGLWGHSRGAAMALVHAAEDGGFGALCSWSAGGHVGRYEPRRLAEWEANGCLQVPIGDGRFWRLERDLYHDYTSHAERYDLTAAALRYSGAWLLVSGERDRATTPAEVRAFVEGVAERREVPPELRFVANAGHNFGALRRGELRPELACALELTSRFFVRAARPDLSGSSGSSGSRASGC